MKVLLVGVGGVGEAIAVMAKQRPWIEQMVLTDYNVKRAKEVQKKLRQNKRFPVEFIDASKKSEIAKLAKKYKVDLIMNAVDPIFNEQIFDACHVSQGKVFLQLYAVFVARGRLVNGIETALDQQFAGMNAVSHNSFQLHIRNRDAINPTAHQFEALHNLLGSGIAQRRLYFRSDHKFMVSQGLFKFHG